MWGGPACQRSPACALLPILPAADNRLSLCLPCPAAPASATNKRQCCYKERTHPEHFAGSAPLWQHSPVLHWFQPSPGEPVINNTAYILRAWYSTPQQSKDRGVRGQSLPAEVLQSVAAGIQQGFGGLIGAIAETATPSSRGGSGSGGASGAGSRWPAQVAGRLIASVRVLPAGRYMLSRAAAANGQAAAVLGSAARACRQQGQPARQATAG